MCCAHFGDDLLFDLSAIQAARPSARAMAQHIFQPKTDSQVLALSAKQWRAYSNDLKRRDMGRELMRLSSLRNLESEKRKCPGKWNPRTGCRDEKWYRPVGRSIDRVARTVADSPITQIALTAASFTPLAPIALGAGAGLAAARAAGSGMARGRIDSGAIDTLAGAVSPYGRQVLQAGRTVSDISRGKRVDVANTARLISSAIPVAQVQEIANVLPHDVTNTYKQARGLARQAQDYIKPAREIQRGQVPQALQQAGRVPANVTEQVNRFAKPVQQTRRGRVPDVAKQFARNLPAVRQAQQHFQPAKELASRAMPLAGRAQQVRQTINQVRHNPPSMQDVVHNVRNSRNLLRGLRGR